MFVIGSSIPRNAHSRHRHRPRLSQRRVCQLAVPLYPRARRVLRINIRRPAVRERGTHGCAREEPFLEPFSSPIANRQAAMRTRVACLLYARKLARTPLRRACEFEFAGNFQLSVVLNGVTGAETRVPGQKCKFLSKAFPKTGRRVKSYRYVTTIYIYIYTYIDTRNQFAQQKYRKKNS